MDTEIKNEESKGVNVVLILSVIVVVGVILFVMLSSNKSNETEQINEQTDQNMPTTVQEPAENAKVSTEGMTSEVKEFVITANNFTYDVTEIKVKAGEKIKITFVNSEGFHDWVLDEFNAKSSKLNAGEQAVIEFTADKAGTYEYYCSVGNHRAMGMKGSLIVE